MSKLTGCNYDVNEELQQVTDPEQPDDAEFEAWLDSLNERTANGGADRPSRSIIHRLIFRLQHGYSIDKIGFLSREEQIKEMRRLEATAHKRQAAQLRYQRRQAWLHQGSLIGVFGISLTIVVLFVTLIVYSFMHPTPVIAQQVSTGSPDRKFHSKVCPTIDGKPFCDLSENDKSLLGKKVKHVKATCTDTGKVDGPEDCQDPSFFVGDGRESLLTETDLDGKPHLSGLPSQSTSAKLSVEHHPGGGPRLSGHHPGSAGRGRLPRTPARGSPPPDPHDARYSRSHSCIGPRQKKGAAPMHPTEKPLATRLSAARSTVRSK